jgi:outer membrane protein assembly factor BamB
MFTPLHWIRAFIFLASLSMRPDQADPAMFRGGPAHLGVYAAARTPQLSRVIWRFRTGGKIVSSPAYQDGALYFGSSDHNFYSVRGSDGSLRWKFPTGGPVTSSPAVDGEFVFFGSVDGTFYALDTKSGLAKWTFKTSGERRFTAPGIHGAVPRTELMPDPFDVFTSSPTLAGGIVYFGSGDHNVYALDATTGKLKWKFSTGNVVHASPAVINGVVYIGSWDRYFYAINAQTGALVWRFETGNDTTIYNQVGIASSAAVSGGIVFFGCRDGHFYAVNAKTGLGKWNVDNQGGWVIASPAVYKGAVYFPTSDGTRFKAIDIATGKSKFELTNKAVSFSSPAIVNDVAYFGTSDGWLHAVNLVTGKPWAEFQTDGSKENASKYTDPNGKLRNDAIYPDFTLDGIIIGLSRLYSLGSILSSPIIANGMLYVSSTDGNVYALQ